MSHEEGRCGELLIWMFTFRLQPEACRISYILYLSLSFVSSCHRHRYFLSPVDVDVSSLADTVATVLRLCIHGGIPVAVVEYDCVGPSQIHPDAAAASWQNEAEDSAICVEALHEGLRKKEGWFTEDKWRIRQRTASFPKLFLFYDIVLKNLFLSFLYLQANMVNIISDIIVFYSQHLNVLL